MTTGTIVNTIYDVRRANVRRLMQDYGGPTALASELGYANGSYISQVAGPNHRKPVTEKVAREWEEKLSLPKGELDRDLTVEQHLADRLIEIVAMLGEMAIEASVRVTPRQMSQLAQLVHSQGRLVGHIDRAYAQRLIELLAAR